ncbi:MAG: hypothetical protein QXF15_02445 [Candidatus Aenigmatarchaeota archaeon]|nr:hypothetical protein [Candidatus Aenigmarchaeota archaeon]
MNYCPNCGKEVIKNNEIYECKYCGYRGKESFNKEDIKSYITKMSNTNQKITENKKLISAIIAIIWIIIVLILILLRS